MNWKLIEKQDYLKQLKKIMEKMVELQRLCWDLTDSENEYHLDDRDEHEFMFDDMDDFVFNKEAYKWIYDRVKDLENEIKKWK